MKRKSATVVCWLALACAAWGQTATLTGTVVNLAGDPVANAEVRATNAQTKAVYKATASSLGAYTLALPAGTYQVSGGAPGYDPDVRQGFAVAVSKPAELKLRLHDVQLNTLGDGREFFASLAASHPKVTGPTPRLPDGKPDFSGVWWAQDTIDPGKPELTPAAATIKKERDDNFGKDFPQSFCRPLGVLFTNVLTSVWRAVHTPGYMVMISEGDTPGFRQFWLDGRGHPADLGPTWTGNSIGRWEGDTLVVDTIGFNDKSWLPGNVPHTEKMHLTERYRRPELGRLEIEFTIEDPDTFVRPWVIKRTADLAPAEEVIESVCTENERDRAHIVGK